MDIPERFASVRFQKIKDIEHLKITMKHNTRAIKDKAITNESGIKTIDNNVIKTIKGVGTDWAWKQYDNLVNNYSSLIREHKSLNKQYRKNRHTTLTEGVLYFSEGINEDYEANKTDFLERVNQYLNTFEKENDTKILNNVIHTDEAGNIHVHFIFKNFDTNGKSLRTTQKHKERSKHQDLPPKFFADFGKGYHRGIENSKRKNLSIDEYKKLKEQEKELKQLKDEYTSLKAELSSIRQEKAELLQISEDLKKSNQEAYKSFQSIYDDILELKDEINLDSFILKIKRYIKNDNAQRLQKTLDKMNHHMSKHKNLSHAKKHNGKDKKIGF